MVCTIVRLIQPRMKWPFYVTQVEAECVLVDSEDSVSWSSEQS